VLLLGSVTAGLLGLAVVSLVVENWDVGLVSAALGLAAGADLWAELRPRGFVLAGTDGLVTSTGRRITVMSWSDVAAVRVQRRRLCRDRPVVERADGTLVPLPRDVPLEEVRRRRPADGPSG